MTPKSILITGATSGIGRALALAYAEPGVTLALTGRDAERLAEVRTACKSRGAAVIAAALDVRDAGRLAAWIGSADELAPLDLAIANAGVLAGIGFGRQRESLGAATRVVETNVVGVMNTIVPVVERMTPRGRGQVAIMGSLAGFRGLPQSPAYCASKAAVAVYAEALRANLVGTGVGVSLVAAGFVATPFNRDATVPKPLQIDAERAARIIRRGLARRARVIAFPRILYYGLRLLPLLPGRLVDRVLSRIDADIPE